MIRFVAAVVAIVMLSSAACFAQTSITLDVRGAQLSDVVALLATQGHENIVLGGSVPQTTVTIRLANVSLHQALTAIESAYGLAEVHHSRYLELVPSNGALGAGSAANNFTITVDIPNGNASTIAQTLNGLVKDQAFVSAVDSRTIVLSGDAQTVTRAETLARQLGGGASYAYDTVQIHYQAPSEILADLGSMHLTDGAPVYANDRGSTLLVGGSRGFRENIEHVISALDVPTKTITFDMYVLDVQPINDSSNRGILFGQAVATGNGQVSITPGSLVASLVSGYKFPIGLQINDLVASGKARLLASPRLTVASGHTNDFTNGGTYPIAVQNGGLIGGQTVEYFQFGIALHIGATIGANGDVSGSIKASDRDITGFDPNSHLPIMSDRSDEVDDIPMQDGVPIVISGMFSDTESDVLQKLPFLGDIPILGQFFRNRATSHKQDQLMFILVPHRGSTRPSQSVQSQLQGIRP